MIQDILDEILESDPRYTLKENNGNIIQDNVDIVLKTPVMQEGTPINRALFRNLQGDLYTQDRYNKVTAVDNTHLTLDIPLTSYESGKIINIIGDTIGDTAEQPYININNLGDVQILGTVRKNKYYNLIYDGFVFQLQTTTIGANSEPIIITQSGEYEIDPELQYKIILVGGGGGSAAVYNNNHESWEHLSPGGGGGKIEDTYIPNSNTILVTIGAAGSNRTASGTNNVYANATNGGDTIVDNLIAGGGKGGKSFLQSYDGTGTATPGDGGTYSGGSGVEGNRGSSNKTSSGGFETVRVNGGKGYSMHGQTYGNGGNLFFQETSREDIETLTPPTQGIVALYPLV